MPRGDKTGPHGAGSMTGRQLGNCVGNGQMESKFPGAFGRRGFGNGRGMGWGNRSRFGRQEEVIDNPDPNVSKMESLEKEVVVLKEQLESFKKQLSNFTNGD